MPYPATPKTWVAGDVLTAAQLNAELRDALLGAFPLGPPDVAWGTWTPTLANLTLGNGSVTAKYRRIGRLIYFRFKFLLGSTSAVGTGAQFTLPVAAAAEYTGQDLFIAPATLADFGTVTYAGLVKADSTTQVSFQVVNVAGTYATGNAVSAGVPHTWAVNDYLYTTGFYEAAT